MESLIQLRFEHFRVTWLKTYMESASPGYCRDQIIAAVPCSMIQKCSMKGYITFYANISMVYVITLFILIHLPVKDKNSSNRAVYRVQTLLSQARVTCGLSIIGRHFQKRLQFNGSHVRSGEFHQLPSVNDPSPYPRATESVSLHACRTNRLRRFFVVSDV